MNSTRLIFGTIAVLFTCTLLAFVVWRVTASAGYGPAAAVCPGPDAYGYTCETTPAVEYIDATNDTFLYEEQGFIELDLPFPFTFYGTEYNSLIAHVDGAVQFGEPSDELGENSCLTAPLGQLVAPYWEDLDLTLYGYLEYEVVGSSPNRIYVLEWDAVPLYEDESSAVTFEVQFFEESQNIAFLYEEVGTETNGNGRGATIGLASQATGGSLTFSCNQAAVYDGDALLFVHPSTLGFISEPTPAEANYTPAGKPDITLLQQEFANYGPEALTNIKQYWLRQTPPRQTHWQWGDVTGDGIDELALLWVARPEYAQHTALLLFDVQPDRTLTLLTRQPLVQRTDEERLWEFLPAQDKNGDGVIDLVLNNQAAGRVVFTWQAPTLERMR